MIRCSPRCSRRDSLRPGATRWNWCATSATASTAQAFLEGHLTPVYFGSALQEFRRARPARCAHRPCAAAARPAGPAARGPCERAEDDRLRLQDPGQHGPQPPRPHRLHAACLGQAHARHEGEARAHRQDAWRSMPRSSSSPRTARWRRKPMPATSSAFPTTACCASATR